MPDVATFTTNQSLHLPAEVVRRFRPTDRFIVWVEGDTIHLKRLVPSALERVEQASPGEPMSLDEINEVVHEVRHDRRRRQAG